MFRNSIVVVCAVLALFMFAGQARATYISGTVVTCPAGDPLVDFPVMIYVQEQFVYIAYTNYLGHYSVDLWGLIYGQTVTVSLGPASFPCKGCCVTCCKQRTDFYVYQNIIFDDLEMYCGVGKAPPCPSQ